MAENIKEIIKNAAQKTYRELLVDQIYYKHSLNEYIGKAKLLELTSPEEIKQFKADGKAVKEVKTLIINRLLDYYLGSEYINSH